MSYRKKVKRKISKRKIFYRLFLPIMILLIILFFIIGNSNEIDVYEQKIIKMQQFDKELSLEDNTEYKTYYVSADGTSTDGTDINDPMSLAQANKKKYYGNEKVLFKSGDIFYGTINFNVDASEDKMFYIGTYGEGEKPVISGANILTKKEAWENEGNGIYKLDLSNYSNFTGIGRTYWQPYNIGFIADEKGNIYGNRKKSKDELKEQNDFFCEDNYFYTKSDGNPSERLGEIKFVSRNDLIKVSSYTIIEGLNIQYTGAHGIVKKDDIIENVYIHDCIVENIGGSVQNASSFTRYGNGIEFWNQAENILVENCIVRNTYDAGFTFQGSTVITGFKNIIAKNNIFINCTYPIEIFCRNDSLGDDAINIGIEKCSIENNVSINQGRGWGYLVRPDKDSASEIVIWDLPQNKSELEIKNNTNYNSLRLKYIWISTSCKNEYKKAVLSYNNTMYLNKNTYLINNEGSYQDKSILDEYNQEKNSTFRLLSNTEINQISNPEILNSNNYEEIKQYYENLEKEFKYTDIKNEILNKYKEFSTNNKDILTLISGAENKITSIQSSIEATTKDNITQTKLQEIIDNTYSIGTDIVTAFTKNTISKQELIQLIKQINDLGQELDKIYNECGIENTSNKEEIISNIKTLEENFNNNLDLDIIELQDLIYIGKDIQDKENTTYADYIYCTSLKGWIDDILKIYIDKYIADNPVSIKYTTTELTNQNVTATIETNAKIEITNNSNSKEHVFSENGEFIFEYKIKGRSFTIKATVNNIDKVLPSITGIENGQTYSSNVKFGVTENNLDKVEISLNGTKIENYKVGQSLTEEGIYKLKVSDKAGNVVEMVFYILYIDEDDYMFEDDKIVNIMYNTKLSNFGENFPLDMDYAIKRNDQELSESNLVATGDILELKTGEKYTLIVKGDLNSDGIVNITDLVRTQNYILKRRTLTEIEQSAADANRDKQPITIMDLVRIQILILNPPEM